jgi:hypothetical protein
MDRDIVEVLNEALELDRKAVSHLFLECDITCEQSIVEHPRFVVSDDNALTVMGLLQGLCDPPEVIIMVTDHHRTRIDQFCYGRRDADGRIACKVDIR